MPFYRRRPSYRSRRKSSIRSIKPRKTAITKLASAVRRLQVAQRTDKGDYQIAQLNTQSISEPYNVINLSDINGANSIFSTDKVEDFGVQKTKHISTGIDMTIDHSVVGFDETGNVQYTCFLVSLKDEIGSAFDSATGSLTLLPNVHYVSEQGLTLLNKNCFNIHSIKRFNLGNNNEDLGFSSANQYGSMKRWYMKIAPRVNIENPLGNVRLLRSGLDPSKSYYIILFNNNGILDGQLPDWKYSLVSTYRH